MDGFNQRAEVERIRPTGSLPVSPCLDERERKTSDIVNIWISVNWLVIVQLAPLIGLNWIWLTWIELKVLDAVRAAEQIVSNMTPKSPGPNRTTTIVMSKHTLAPQTSTVGSHYVSFYQLFVVELVLPSCILYKTMIPLYLPYIFRL